MNFFKLRKSDWIKVKYRTFIYMYHLTINFFWTDANFSFCSCYLKNALHCYLLCIPLGTRLSEMHSGCEIVPNTGANATKFFTLATKSWKLGAKLATRMFHHNLTKRYSELKRFAKINPRQTSSLSLFPKRSTCLSIDN